MRIGIYNRWLATLGGGEKYSLAIAEHLSRQHDVTVISHKFVSKDEAAHRLNLDLSKVTFEFVPEVSSIDLGPMTEDFDFFINGSFMDFIPSYAKYSAAVIYFPAVIPGMRTSKYRFGWWVKKEFLLPAFGPEFNGLRRLPDQSYQITGKNGLTLQFQNAETFYPVRFKVEHINNAAGIIDILLDGQSVQQHNLGIGDSVDIHLVIPSSLKAFHEVRIRMDQRDKEARFVAVSQLDIEHPKYKKFKPMLVPFVNRVGMRFMMLPFAQNQIIDAVDTYTQLWGISLFTQKWIKTYWNRDSCLLYPPIDVDNFAPLQKKPIILNVGRFFEGNHNKKHLVMINAFKQMVDQGLTGWELHLAGGTTSGDTHERYMERINAEAKGYPIVIHPDIEYTELVKLYGESSIYWHASGYGEDESSEPVKFEHFGITTVEAMASGCVPVVIGKGGQTEIVQHGKNGFLWVSTSELKKYTQILIDDKNALSLFAKESILSSRQYSLENFQKRIDQLCAEILK